MSSVSKAGQRAVAKYVKNNYDRIEVKVPKGRKDSIRAAADAVNESLNKYIYKATSERIGKESNCTKIYTIIGGVNGTGKSSLSGVLATQEASLGEVIDVDKLTAAKGVSPLEGGKLALSLINECLENGISFTQETTLSGYRTRQTASNARQRGYYIRLYYIGLNSPEECLARIANRVARGGHNISEGDVLRRFSGRWEAVKRILPYCNEARFFDNYNGFIEVAEYRNGELLFKEDTPPEWVLELAEYLT